MHRLAILILVCLCVSCTGDGDRRSTLTPSLASSFTSTSSQTSTATSTRRSSPTCSLSPNPSLTRTATSTLTPTKTWIYIPPSLTPSQEAQSECTPVHLFCGAPTIITNGAEVCAYLFIPALAQGFGETCLNDPVSLDQGNLVCEIYTCYPACQPTYLDIFQCTTGGNE